jgi:hypothetical protein
MMRKFPVKFIKWDACILVVDLAPNACASVCRLLFLCQVRLQWRENAITASVGAFLVLGLQMFRFSFQMHRVRFLITQNTKAIFAMKSKKVCICAPCFSHTCVTIG